MPYWLTGVADRDVISVTSPPKSEFQRRLATDFACRTDITVTIALVVAGRRLLARSRTFVSIHLPPNGWAAQQRSRVITQRDADARSA